MKDFFPTLLFRFRSLSGPSENFTKSIITRNEIYFSDPASLNDPYDCQPTFDINGSPDEWKRHLSRSLKMQGSKKISISERIRITRKWMAEEKYKNINPETFKQLTSRFGIACFSASMNNMLLWTHYADNHRGICLIFEPSKDSYGALTHSSEIQYQSELPHIRLVDLSETGDSKIIKILLTKSKQWQHEQEYRLILPYGAKQSLQFHPSSLIGIVLGAKISKEHEAKVRSWAAAHPYRPIIHSGKLSSNSYDVVIHHSQ